MYKPLPVDGAPPCTVVLHAAPGTDPGELQDAYVKLLGPINHFYAKAAQARDLGELPQTNMQQNLPGARLRFQHNNGLETVHVHLAAPKALAAPVVSEEPRFPTQPELAIDVVFEASTYEAGDVFSHTVSGVTIDPNSDDLSDWTETVITTFAEIEAHYLEGVSSGSVTITESGRFPIIPAANPQGIVLGRAVSSNGPVEFPEEDTIYASDVSPDGPPYPDLVAAEYVVVRVSTQAPESYLEAMYLYLLSTFVAPDSTQDNFREQVTWYNTMNVVGLIGDVGDDEYSALSTGTYTDGRLRSLTQDGADATASRTVTIDSAPPGFSGAGFVAKPRRFLAETDPDPAPTIIDVYVASLNLSKANEFPGEEGSTFEADDPSFTYATEPEVQLRIRVREFDVEGHIVVRVAAEVQERREPFHAAESTPTSFPDVADPVVNQSDGRDNSWKFAAKSGWQDTGGEPADPLADSMGELLAESDLLVRTVATPAGPPRQLFYAPEWDEPVTAMTKVATIEWQPARQIGVPGEATITPA